VESADAGWVRFVVADTGIGIDDSQLAGLFQEFTQADASTTRRFGGSGLGLAISKRLVDLMGGALVVRSRPGCGSTFTAALPLPAVEPAACSPADAPQGRNSPALRLPPGCRILLAEDNPVNRMIAQRFLAGTGCVVDTAETGIEAVARHLENPYDLILMDCHMPDMDGFEATAAIRAQIDGSRVPIVAVTASALPEDRERCHTAGMNGYVSKPLHRDQLVDAIASALASRELDALRTAVDRQASAPLPCPAPARPASGPVS